MNPVTNDAVTAQPLVSLNAPARLKVLLVDDSLTIRHLVTAGLAKIRRWRK